MRTNATDRLLPPADARWRFGIVYAPFYKEEVEAMVADARRVLIDAGIPDDHVTLHDVPGSFEIPLIGRALAKAQAVDALLGFGIIVQGETKHADLLATETARGIMDVQLRYGIPFAFEVLYVQDLALARARAMGEHGKGKEAAYAALHSLVALNRIQAHPS
jgi:6,7-dimethyl-8-ribityllumazine synthase